MEVNEKSAADFEGSAAPVHSRETTAVSRCSCRHAEDPWLTNKDGEQKAKDEDDDEAEQHDRDVFPLKTSEPPVRRRSGG
jgi:hypothetical protein